MAEVLTVTELSVHIWHAEEIPEEWREGIIIPLPKKGCLSDCNNWRGIILLCIPGKIFCSMRFNRLKAHVDQAGFRSGRSCTEQILILCNIIERSRKWQKAVYINLWTLRRRLTVYIGTHYGKLCSSMAYNRNVLIYFRHCITTRDVASESVKESPTCLTSSLDYIKDVYCLFSFLGRLLLGGVPVVSPSVRQ